MIDQRDRPNWMFAISALVLMALVAIAWCTGCRATPLLPLPSGASRPFEFERPISPSDVTEFGARLVASMESAGYEAVSTSNDCFVFARDVDGAFAPALTSPECDTEQYCTGPEGVLLRAEFIRVIALSNSWPGKCIVVHCQLGSSDGATVVHVVGDVSLSD